MREKLLRYFANESPHEERKQVEKLLKESEEARKYISYLESVWMNSGEKKVNWNVEKAWNRFSQTAGIENTSPIGRHTVNKTDPYRRQRNYRYRASSGYSTFFKVAAIIVVLVFTPLILMWLSGFFNGAIEQEIVERNVTTKKGQYTRITLSDGSRVMLNAESSLGFPERFTGEVREIYLEGEAYFEVVNDADRIFRVYAEGALIEVLGTSFNINARVTEYGQVNVVVSEGTVTLKGKEEKAEQAVTITKGMMSGWSKEKGASVPVKVNLQSKLAWLRGELNFEGTPLRDVIIQLERRYNIIINVEDESLLSRRLTASFHTEPIDEIIQNVAFTIDVTYRKKEDNLYYLK